MYYLLNDLQISKNFKISEFVCNDGSSKVLLEMALVAALQLLRNIVGPVIISSGYRTLEWNAKEGGSPNSLHLSGKAADIKVSGKTPLEVALAAEKVGFKGIGVYTHDGNSFTHCDIRNTKCYWKDDTGHKTIAINSLAELSGEQPKYSTISTTEIAEIPPMMIKEKLVYLAGNKIIENSFINGCYQWYKDADKKYHCVGWIISECKALNYYDVDELLNGTPRKKGTFLIYKDGHVEVKNMSNLEVKAIAANLWFCIQGFNLFPLNLIGEGYDPNAVGRATFRIGLGYNPTTKKVVIAYRPDTDPARIKQSIANLGCNIGIGLDAGSTCNVKFGGKAIHLSDALLTNIIYW